MLIKKHILEPILSNKDTHRRNNIYLQVVQMISINSFIAISVQKHIGEVSQIFITVLVINISRDNCENISIVPIPDFWYQKCLTESYWFMSGAITLIY